MASFVYVENVKDPSVRFRVKSYDKETKMGTLEGEFGAEFSRSLSKADLAKFGYRLVKSEVELPLLSAAKAKEKAAPKKTKKVETAEEEE